VAAMIGTTPTRMNAGRKQHTKGSTDRTPTVRAAISRRARRSALASAACTSSTSATAAPDSAQRARSRATAPHTVSSRNQAQACASERPRSRWPRTARNSPALGSGASAATCRTAARNGTPASNAAANNSRQPGSWAASC